jgi:hypothetical protein
MTIIMTSATNDGCDSYSLVAMASTVVEMASMMEMFRFNDYKYSISISVIGFTLLVNLH